MIRQSKGGSKGGIDSPQGLWSIILQLCRDLCTRPGWLHDFSVLILFLLLSQVGRGQLSTIATETRLLPSAASFARRTGLGAIRTGSRAVASQLLEEHEKGPVQPLDNRWGGALCGRELVTMADAELCASCRGPDGGEGPSATMRLGFH